MAPHHHSTADILPFGPPKDYPAHLAQANGDEPDLIEQLRQSEREHHPTWRDDLVDLIADIQSHPVLALTCTVAGFLFGTFGILGMAEIVMVLS